MIQMFILNVDDEKRRDILEMHWERNGVQARSSSFESVYQNFDHHLSSCFFYFGGLSMLKKEQR